MHYIYISILSDLIYLFIEDRSEMWGEGKKWKMLSHNGTRRKESKSWFEPQTLTARIAAPTGWSIKTSWDFIKPTFLYDNRHELNEQNRHNQGTFTGFDGLCTLPHLCHGVWGRSQMSTMQENRFGWCVSSQASKETKEVLVYTNACYLAIYAFELDFVVGEA